MVENTLSTFSSQKLYVVAHQNETFHMENLVYDPVPAKPVKRDVYRVVSYGRKTFVLCRIDEKKQSAPEM